ncbi:MAG: DUF4055 domain-containing protein, partial [Actinobacteria bacterium]|nr:DUF4055 domain-containing protein [Actinomycetota bacterium]
VNNHRMSFQEILNDTLFEMSLQARCGILIDRSPDDGPNDWPYPVLYRAEDIVNCHFDDMDTYIILRESHVVQDEKDRYKQLEVTRYRELVLVASDEGPIYTQYIYDDEGDLIETIIPTNQGEPLNYIPFVPISARGLNLSDSKPTMLDVANVNLSHYRSGADLEHGRHFTGLPTPVILGAESDRRIYLGSSEVIVIPGKGTDAKFLEFTGRGLGSLEKAMSEKEDQMISLSAKAMQESGNGSESSEALMLRYSSEAASLRAIVDVAEMAMNRMLEYICDFKNESLIQVEMSRAFLDSNITSDDAQKWFKVYVDGGISKETLAYIYRTGGVYPDGFDVDKAISDITASQSVSPTSTTDTIPPTTNEVS